MIIICFLWLVLLALVARSVTVIVEEHDLLPPLNNRLVLVSLADVICTFGIDVFLKKKTEKTWV